MNVFNAVNRRSFMCRKLSGIRQWGCRLLSDSSRAMMCGLVLQWVNALALLLLLLLFLAFKWPNPIVREVSALGHLSMFLDWSHLLKWLWMQLRFWCFRCFTLNRSDTWLVVRPFFISFLRNVYILVNCSEVSWHRFAWVDMMVVHSFLRRPALTTDIIVII